MFVQLSIQLIVCFHSHTTVNSTTNVRSTRLTLVISDASSSGEFGKLVHKTASVIIFCSLELRLYINLGYTMPAVIAQLVIAPILVHVHSGPWEVQLHSRADIAWLRLPTFRWQWWVITSNGMCVITRVLCLVSGDKWWKVVAFSYWHRTRYQIPDKAIHTYTHTTHND